MLVELRERVESFGLEFYGIRLLPWKWTYKWQLGLPGRDEQLENLRKTVRNMGAAAMPMLVYNMHALRQYRTSSAAPQRGGTTATEFSYEDARDLPLMEGGPGTDTSLIPESHRRPITDDQMWDNLAYLLEAIIPVAEEAGVRLALHPDDPPVPSLGGVARIMRSPEAFRRVVEMAPSDHHGIGFCQGCFAEMGADVPEEIRYFGSRGKIFFVDFRNVTGSTERFCETFPDDGDVDMAESMRAYKEVGFDGPMSPDHILHIDGDSTWGHQYWSYAVGHMKGLAQAINI
jgi:mannonate dehydratase